MDPDFAYKHSRQGVTVNRTIDTLLGADEELKNFHKLKEELKWLQRKYQIVTEMFEEIMDEEAVRETVFAYILPLAIRFYRGDDENLAEELIDDLCLFYDKEFPVSDSDCRFIALENMLVDMPNRFKYWPGGTDTDESMCF